MFFNEQQIEGLRKVYNEEHRKDSPIPSGQAESVWKEMQSRMRKQCDRGTAECIIGSMISRPTAPDSWRTHPEEWLSSDDIDAVEKQYARIFKNYYYVGTVPIDFGKKSKTGECLVDSLCYLDITSLYKKGFTQIGIVFNTDKSTGPGKHWIALFCDIRPELEFPRITYWDSYANKPEKEIQVLMQRWKEEWDSTNIHSQPMKKTYNKTKHQRQDSECGMYSLYFHFCCLLGIPMDKRIPDEVVRGFRGVLYRIR
jgi:hypothetical protein